MAEKAPETTAAADPNELIAGALTKAMALRAAYLGKKVAADKVSADATDAINLGQEKRDKAIIAANEAYADLERKQQEKIGEASQAVAEAERALADFQTQLQAELGIGLDLFPASGGGGHTRL